MPRGNSIACNLWNQDFINMEFPKDGVFKKKNILNGEVLKKQFKAYKFA